MMYTHTMTVINRRGALPSTKSPNTIVSGFMRPRPESPGKSGKGGKSSLPPDPELPEPPDPPGGGGPLPLPPDPPPLLVLIDSRSLLELVVIARPVGVAAESKQSNESYCIKLTCRMTSIQVWIFRLTVVITGALASCRGHSSHFP